MCHCFMFLDTCRNTAAQSLPLTMAIVQKCRTYSENCRQRKVLAAATCATACCVYIYMYMNVNVRSTTTMKTLNYNSLANAIASRASRDRYIIIAMADESFIDMAINLHEASLRPHHIDNYLFIGVGKFTCGVLYRQSLACFHYVDIMNSGHSSNYGTADFARKVNVRNDIVLEALSANFTVVLTDVDVVFLDNPLNEIKVRHFVVLPQNPPIM